MIVLATAENGWGDLAPLFGVGVLTGLSPWLFALKGLPWFPRIPIGAAGAADGGDARLLFTATASICSGWVYMIFVSLPPIHFLVMHRGMVALLSSFGALLIYVALWLSLNAMNAVAWPKGYPVLFVVAFGSYVLTFTSLAISVSVATAFQENYLIEGEVVDAQNKADAAPAPADAIIKAQALDASDIDETETDKNGKFLLVVPRKSIEAHTISIIATLQNNQLPTSDQLSPKIHLRGWNKVRIIFHPAVKSSTTTASSSPMPSPSPTPERGH
jgi:hypothetical protein